MVGRPARICSRKPCDGLFAAAKPVKRAQAARQWSGFSIRSPPGGKLVKRMLESDH